MDSWSGTRGFVHEDDLRFEEYIAGAGEQVKQLAGGFRALKWGPEEIEAFMNTAKYSGSSLVRTGVSASLMTELAEAKKATGVDNDYNAMKAAGVHITTIHVDLTSEQQQFMRDDLAGLTVMRFAETGRGERVKHALPHAMNAAMSVQMFRNVPRGAVVLEVGASLRAAMRRGHDIGRYFAACPALDAKDLQRYNTQMRAIRVAYRRSGPHSLKPHQARFAKAILDDPSSIVIRKKVQEIKIAADYIVSLQANWDIPMEQVPAIMYNCGSKAWYMVMNRISGLDFTTGRRRGKEAGLGITWEADADRDEIIFSFESDSSLPYVHKLSVVRSYQDMTVREFECNGRYYVFSETANSTNSQLMLSCVDMGVRSVPTPLGYNCSVSGLHNMVKVTVPTMTSSVAAGVRKKYKTVSFMVGAEAFSRVLQERVLAGAGGSADTVIAYARSNRVSVVYNGVRVSVENPIAVEHFRQFAVAVDALSMDVLRSADVDVKAVVDGLAGGGYGFHSPAAMLGAATGITSHVSALVDAVVLRLKALTDDLDSTRGVKVEKVSGVVMKPRSPRVKVKAYGVRQEPLFHCFCVEKAELKRMMQGEHGGLSVEEAEALQCYYKILESRVCQRCVKLEDIIADDWEREREKLEEEEEEDNDKFFDCASPTVVPSDSGYGSSSASVKEDSANSVRECGLGASCAEDAIIDDAKEIPMTREEERKVIEKLEGSFGSAFTSEAGQKTRMRLAAEEYVHVLRLQTRAIEDGVRKKWMVASMSCSDDQSVLDAVSDEYCWYSFVDVAHDGRIVKVHRNGVGADAFQRIFDYKADVFRPVWRTRSGEYFTEAGASSRVCTSGSMKIWNQPRLIDRSLELLRPGGFLDGPEVRIDFVNGVFGCGKTRGIKRSYVKNAVPGKRLILTSTRRAAEQLRQELFASDSDGEAAKKYIRTYDSVLIHGVQQWFEEVAMDELAALTMGQAVLILAYLQPAKIRAYGDFYQMEAKPFCDWRFEYPTVEPLCNMEYMSMSHRVRLSIMASSLTLYPPEANLAVCNCCENVIQSEEGGPHVNFITSIADVPMREGVAYFTAGQGDAKAVREALRASGAVPRDKVNELVCTYAESQGVTVKNAICVRLERQTKPGSIHHEKKRANVGKSRTQEVVEYYTASMERDCMRIAADDAADEQKREIVRKNSQAMWKKIAQAGGADQFFESFFDMRALTYVY